MKNTYKKLSPKARMAMVLSSIEWTIIIGLILIAIRAIVHLFAITRPIHRPLDIIFIIIVLIPALSIILNPTIGYKRIAYSISDVSVEKITGIINIEREIIPVRRMQQINIESRWINRMLGLANISIVTAGGNAELEYIEMNEAIEIAENLKKVIHEMALIQAKNQEGYSADISEYLGQEPLDDTKEDQ